MDLSKASTAEWQEFIVSVLNNSPFGIIAFDVSGKITISNKRIISLLDLNSSLIELTGLNVVSCTQHLPTLSEKLGECIQKAKKKFILDLGKINGKFLNISAHSIKNGYILIVDDVTKLKDLEASSVQSIIAGQEIERRRLAREIHDGIGPLLSTIKLNLDYFLDDYNHQKITLPVDKLFNIRETIDSITNDLRDLSHRLLPRLLDEFGLFSAFNNLAIRFTNTSRTSIEFYCNFASETRFNREIELNLYRCGQELITNAVKHAKASEILMQLILHEKTIVLMVDDNGIGFEPGGSYQNRFGIGLTNIKTRVRTLHGEFTLDSVKNKGTTASIEIPL